MNDAPKDVFLLTPGPPLSGLSLFSRELCGEPDPALDRVDWAEPGADLGTDWPDPDLSRLPEAEHCEIWRARVRGV